jgi:hypothetical protein
LRSWQPWGGQLPGQPAPSHFSPQAASTMPLPQLQVHSASLLRLQAGGQQPSPLPHVLMSSSFTHSASHWAALPCNFRRWQPMAGQLVGQSVPSHFSLPSRTPLPQRVVQSVSLVLLQTDGQQPSPFMHAVSTPSSTHSA